MGRKDNLVAGILIFSMVLIFLITTYFCLDIFGIIDVPKKYSIASILGKTTSEVSQAMDLDEIITQDTIDEWINAKHKVKDNPNERDIQNGDITPPVIENNTTQTPSEQTPNQDFTNVVNRMYYSQLDSYGKMIYTSFIDNKDKLLDGKFEVDFGTTFNDLLHEDGGDELLETDFQLSVNSLMFDNPELFYLDVTKLYMSTEITSLGPIKIYRVKIGPSEGGNYLSDKFQDEQMVQAADSTLEGFRREFAEQIKDLADYEKIKKVHDYIVDTAEYDQTLSRDNIYNVYGTLMQHCAVCEGYSKTLKYMLDAANIPCVIACGIAQNSNGETESHAWNYVKIDDAWYAVDCTWDDPVILGSGYVSKTVHTKFFLKGSNEFFKDHFEDGNIVNNSKFAYPTISEENYIR